MPRMSAVYLCLAVAASALAGCAPAPLYPESTVYWGTFPEQPPDYSPDYTSRARGRQEWPHTLCARPESLPCAGPDRASAPWDRICRRAAPTRTTSSAWPSASLTWFTAARSAPLPRLRRRERRRNTFMAPRAPWGAAFRARRAALPQGPGTESETEKPPATR